MDRRTVLRGAGALALLPLLPALQAIADTPEPIAFNEPTKDWHHYAVTKDGDKFTAYVDGVEVSRPEGMDYDVLEELTLALESGRAGPVCTAEVWKAKSLRYYENFLVRAGANAPA